MVVTSPRPLADAAARDLIRTALDETLVVEAAAGTGKTTELVARIVRLLATRKATIDQIVAVTFTEKAAGELKLRIRTELEKARVGGLASDRIDGFRGQALDEALAHLEEAHVSTIHGFCADLLRERPVEARVDPGFEVLTEAAADRLFDRAFRKWFQQRLEDPSEGIRRALRRLPSQWSSYADDEDTPVARLQRAANDLREWRDLRAAWQRDPFDRQADVGRCIEALCTFADLTDRPSWDKDPLYEGTRFLRQVAADFRRALGDELRGASLTDVDGAEALLVRLAKSREFKDIAKRRGRKPDYSKHTTRQQILDEYERLSQLLTAR
jgi:ATP-dependent helicase/nuclease subunit A